MSEDSRDLNLKSTDSNNTHLNETKKKERRNYCDVCQVQCTAKKNLEEHNLGKRHQKKLSIATKRQKKSEVVKKDKNVTASRIHGEKSNLASSKSKVTSTDLCHEMPLNCKTSETMDSRNSHSNFRGNKLIRNTKPPVNNFFGFPSIPNYRNTNRNNHSNFDPYYRTHYYGNRQPCYNSFNYTRYSRWNSSYPQHVNNDFYEIEQNNSNYNRGQPRCSLQSPENLVENRNPLIRQTSSNVDNSYERRHCESSNVAQEDSLNSRKSINNSHNTSSVTQRENTSCSKDQSTSNVAHIENSKSSQETSSPLSRISNKKRIRSRSLSCTESNFSNETRKIDQNENQSADSDGAEQQKIKDWTNTLLETSHGQISRLIHPSNYKEKAAVNHLITNLSKSKRKENLSRLKFRSDSICSNETNDDEKEIEEVDIINESVQGVEETPSQNNCEVIKDNADISPGKKSKKNYSKSCKLSDALNNEIDYVANKFPKKLSIPKEIIKETDSLSSSKKSTKNNEKTDIATDKLKRTKRKSLNSSSNVTGKKRRSSDKSVENISISKAREQQSISDSSATSSTSTAGIAQVLDTCVSFILKEEVAEFPDENPPQPSPVLDAVNNQPQNLDFNSEFSVETLINLFATGDVKVKREFNDPVIEAIKAVDPSVLLNACSDKFMDQNKNNEESQLPTNSIPAAKSPVPSSSNDFDKDDSNSISPVILGATVTSASDSPVSMTHSNVLPSSNLPFVNPDPGINISLDKSASKSSFSDFEDINFMPKNKSDHSPHLKELIKDLQQISSQEENVKQNLIEVKSKINEYQTLLEEWKNRKKKLQDEEEDLRKKRVGIIELMQNAVKSTGEISNEKESNATLQLPSKRQLKVTESSKPSECSNQPIVGSPKPISPNPSKSYSKKKTKSSLLSESDEISILPVKMKESESDEISILPVKMKEPELIVIDGEDIDTPSQRVGGSNQNKVFTASKNVQSVFDMKNLTTHPTIVNCLLVFEDYLYTCSNDSTAKRFNLKDPSETVTYLHGGKNVTEIVVEKVQSEALVFTSASNRTISLFIASNGTKIKTYFHSCSILTICKGWGKFFSGMADGSINVYNWKYEEKEIIRSEHPASRIATAHQGRLHVLIILCSNGNISVRDAETGLLIRCIKGFVKIPSWLTVFNDLAYLSSSDKTLTIFDILTGRSEKKLYITDSTTGLAVFEDYIFTISYSGLISCYNKEKMSDKKVYYGAGKNCLTCIHVYQDWVFTGNRKGEINVFKFDTSGDFPCQFGQCTLKFGIKTDLVFHVEKDHVNKKKVCKCNWSNCTVRFESDWSVEDKMRHLNRHINENVI